MDITGINIATRNEFKRLPGQYYDEETGLHYNYFRYYDPSIGRYITSDPIGLRGGFNTYGYVEHNPFTYIDRYGLVKWTGEIEITDFGRTPFGFAQVNGELVSECIDGQQYHVFILGYFAGFNLSIFPGGYSKSTETLNDGLPYIYPYVFNGRSKIETIGVQAGKGFASSNLIFGGASTPPTGMGKINSGVTSGLGEGILQMLGNIFVIGTPFFTECEEC